MDLQDSTYILQDILTGELDQKSTRNRCWTRKLAQVSDLDALISSKLARALVKVLASKTIILRIPGGSVPLFTEKCLNKRGVERLPTAPGYWQYYAAQEVPTEVLFRKKKACYTEAAESTAQIFDLRAGWVEILPFEIRFIEGKLVIRAAKWLEDLRHETEKDILRIKNDPEWRKASKKARAKLDYCSISAFDRILIVDLLRRNFMRLTPKAVYYYPLADSFVSTSSAPKYHNLIITVSPENRTQFCATKPRSLAWKTKAKARREKETSPKNQ